MSSGDVSAATTVDVGSLIDDHPLGRWQVWVIVLCGAALFSDGYDTAAMGYVAPTLGKLWGLKPGALGPVFGAALAGLMVGALVLGPLADRVGRRWMIILSTTIFSVCSLVTPLLAHDVDSLFWIRFATGLGLGGLTPNAVAVSSEYAPARVRSTLVMTMFIGFISGSALGGAIAASLIPLYGWQSVFYCGGAAPLMLVPLLIISLPESIRVLTMRGTHNHRVAALLERINRKHSYHPERTSFVVPEIAGEGFPVRLLFRHGRAPVTLLLWVMFFINLLEIYFIANWLPTIANNAGLSQQSSVLATSLLYAGGIVSTPFLGYLIDRFGPYRLLAATYVLGGIFIALLGYTVSSGGVLMLTAFCTGACIMGAQNGANALAAVYYPTVMRSTGVGWANGIGRIGSIVGPVLGGIIISLNWTTQTIFLLGGVLTIMATLAVLTAGRLVEKSARIRA